MMRAGTPRCGTPRTPRTPRKVPLLLARGTFLLLMAVVGLLLVSTAQLGGLLTRYGNQQGADPLPAGEEGRAARRLMQRKQSAEAEADLEIEGGIRLWLYTLVAADYDGASLLPHFLEHYHALGIPYSHMLIHIHHHPGKYPRNNLLGVQDICEEYGVRFWVWEGEFLYDTHLAKKLEIFYGFDPIREDPQAWIVIADLDELQDYGGRRVGEFLAQVDAEGATVVNGTFIDRLAPNGHLPTVARAPALAEQFPWRCYVVGQLYPAPTVKVVAFKAFLRPGFGNHRVVPVREAPKFFGPCPQPDCHRSQANLYADWYSLTPYSMFQGRYRLPPKRGEPRQNATAGLWDIVPSPRRITIDHYKWHVGVISNLRDRAMHSRGNCSLDSWSTYDRFKPDNGCTPTIRNWNEPYRVYVTIAEMRQINMTGIRCLEEQPLQL